MSQINLAELEVKAPKVLAKSTTLAMAGAVRAVSILVGIVATVGTPTIIFIVPDEHKPAAEAAIAVIFVLGMAFNVSRASEIRVERKSRGDLFGAEKGAASKFEDALYWVAARPDQFEKLKKVLTE